MIVYVVISSHYWNGGGGIEVMFDSHSKAVNWIAAREAVAEHNGYMFTIKEHMVY